MDSDLGGLRPSRTPLQKLMIAQASVLATAGAIHRDSGDLPLAVESLTHAVLLHQSTTGDARDVAESVDVAAWTMDLGSALMDSGR